MHRFYKNTTPSSIRDLSIFEVGYPWWLGWVVLEQTLAVTKNDCTMSIPSRSGSVLEIGVIKKKRYRPCHYRAHSLMGIN
jgi:hypothetical protein